MSETMIERVARAIDPRDWENWESWCSLKKYTPEEAAEEFVRSRTLQDSLERARAAIEALREPTPQMVSAGRDMLRAAGLLPAYTDESTKGEPIMSYMLKEQAWPAMIDAALSPNKEPKA